jgi:hypothetical protein
MKTCIRSSLWFELECRSHKSRGGKPVNQQQQELGDRILLNVTLISSPHCT